MRPSIGSAVLALALVLNLPACSDDASDPATGGDTGGSDVSADTSGPTTYELFLHFPDDDGERGDPAEGVAIAIDGPDGRQEIMTDANGRYELTLGPNDEIDVTIALEGYVIVSSLGLTRDRIESIQAANPDANRVTLVELVDVEAFLANEVEVTFTATGVPDGGYFCTSSEEFNWACAFEGRDGTETIQASTEAVPITAFAFDSDWRMVDSERLELSSISEATSVEVTFDGTLEPAITEVEMLLYLPDDTDSVFRTDDIVDIGPFPFVAFEPGTRRLIGGAYDENSALDNEWIEVTLQYEPPTEGDAVFLALASTGEGTQRSFTYLERDPVDDDVFLWMDAPRVSEPTSAAADLSASFDWQDIPDADLMQVRIAGGGRVLWVANTGTSSEAQLPRLPSAYDRTADWPADGEAGNFQVWAFRDPDQAGAAELAEPLRRNLLQSFSVGHQIVLSGP